MKYSAGHRGGQKLRYISAVLLGLLILGTAGASFWYVLIFSKKSITAVQIEFSGVSIPLSDELIQEIDGLKGLLLKDIHADEVRERLLKQSEISDAEVRAFYPGRVDVKLTSKTPLAFFRLTQGSFSFQQQDASSAEELLVVFLDGSTMPGYPSLITGASAAVPLVEIGSESSIYEDEKSFDTQLEAFLRMLHELKSSSEKLYSQISHIYFDLQGDRELDFIVQSNQGRLSCTVPEPISGERLTYMLKAAVSAAQREISLEKIRITLLSNHAVLSRR